MADSWNPFKKDEKPNADPTNAANGAPVEKTASEMLAETLTAANKPLLDQLGAMQKELSDLRAASVRPAPLAASDPMEPVSVFDNEDAAFAQRVGPIAAQQLALSARITYNDIKSEYLSKGYGEVFGQFEDEIKGILETSPLLQPDGQGGTKPCRGDAVYIRNVINMVFGQAAIKAGMKFGGKEKGFFIESANGDAGTNQPIDAGDGLTDAQRKVFTRMKVPAGDAKKTMAKLKFIS